MIAIVLLFVRLLCVYFKSRRRLEAEILILRHQLNVLHRRAPHRLSVTWADRALRRPTAPMVAILHLLGTFVVATQSHR